MSEDTKSTHFDVSSGLKLVLGRVLITDNGIAIFELVKNASDAETSQVDIYFNNNMILVEDNRYGREIKCPRYTQVGNAMPSLMAEAIGEQIIGLTEQ